MLRTKSQAKPAVDSTPLKSAFQEKLAYHVKYSLAQEWDEVSPTELFEAVSLAVRDQMIDGYLKTEARYQEQDVKRLNYLSMEFLMGRALRHNLSNLGIYDVCREELR